MHNQLNPTPSSPKPFIDYYNAQGIIPVRQDLTDINGFVFRRNYLYKTLGIPLTTLKGRNIIEFGPGGGFNASATTYFGPESYVFVDATLASLEELKRKQAAGIFKAKNIEIIQSNIFDYRDERKYEVVICEGVIPCQNDPRGMIRHVGSFCNNGGILITTTMTATSLLSEICRRVFRPSIVSLNKTFTEQTQICTKLFNSHFDQVGAARRPVEDWAQDMILHDWHMGEYVFTMTDSIAALEKDFEYYSSSPRFLIDDRWYKKVNESSVTVNDLLNQQYAALNTFLLDTRVSLKDILQIKDSAKLSIIELLCKSACVIHDKIVQENSFNRLEDFITALRELSATLPEEFDVTKISISDFISGIRKFAMGDENADFDSFKKWWGRGQQYISFINKHVS